MTIFYRIRALMRWLFRRHEIEHALDTELADYIERSAAEKMRPAVAVERLTLTSQGNIHYRLKTPYRDGTTHILLEPLDLLARLASRVPPPRAHLTRYHGVCPAGGAARRDHACGPRAERAG